MYFSNTTTGSSPRLKEDPLSCFFAVSLQLGSLDQNVPQTLSHLRVPNFLKEALHVLNGLLIKRFLVPSIVFCTGRKGWGNLSCAEPDVLKERLTEERVYLFEELRFKKLKLLNPRGMGDVHEEDTISDSTRLCLIGQGFTDDLPPRPPDGIGLQLRIDLKAFQGAFQDRTDRLGFAFSGHF